MQESSSLSKLLNEDEITDSLLFRCSVCGVCFGNKDEWMPHASGYAHISQEVKTPNVHNDISDIRSRLIARSEVLLGNQKKFVEVAIEESLCTFTCVLCEIKMTSYFGLSGHLEDGFHAMKVQEYESFREGKNESTTSSSNIETSSKKSGILHTELACKMVDRSTRNCTSNYQGLENAVEEVSKFFSGTLQCVNCRLNIALNPSTMTNHLHGCIMEEDRTKDVHSIESKLIDLLRCAAAGNVSPLEELEVKVSELPISRNNEVEQHLSAAVFHHLQTEAANPSVVKPQTFECLKCDMKNSIYKWEEHVTNHHSVSSEKQGNGRNFNDVACVCTLCQLLIFGQRDDVIRHEHFALKNKGLFFLFSSHPHMKNILDCSHELPRYYRCSQNPSFVDCTKVAFYCLSCGFYGLDKLKQHFQSKNHRMRNYPYFEFYYCAVCSILFYADRLLFEDHRRTPPHILSKAAMRPNSVRPAVDFLGRSHEDLLSSLKAEVLKHWNVEPWNIYYSLAFWCESCAYFTDKKDEWLNVHLTSEAHAVQMKKEYFEHMCVLCKITFIGGAEFHSAHFSSEGHKNIKTEVFRELNRKRMTKKQSYVYPHPESTNEEQMASSAAKIDHASTNSNDNEGKNSKHLFKRPITCNEKSYNLENDPYSLELDYSIVIDEKLATQFFAKIVQKRGSFGRVKNYFCMFCNFHSPEKTWWSHMKSQEHKTKYLSQMTNSTKSKKVNIIFCSQCSLFGVGDGVMRQKHIYGKSHEKMCAKGDLTKNGICSSSPISLSTTDDEDENFATPNEMRRTRTIFPSIDTSNLIKASSDSSNDEKNEVENAQDELYDIIMREESDMERTGNSEDELDKSVLDEVKRNNTVSKMTAIEGSDEIDHELEKNIEYTIVVSGIPKPVMKNRVVLREAFSKYIKFDRTFVRKNKPDSVHLVVSKNLHDSFKILKENIQHLMSRWGTDELTVQLNSEEKCEISAIKEQLLEPAVLLFSNKPELFNAVTHMIHLYDAEAYSNLTNRRIQELLNVLHKLAMHIYREYRIIVKTHVFGSRVTGLAAENSDVDVYLQIGASFRGLISNNVELQQQLVVLFSKEMRRHPFDFCKITSIPFARVPIVKFKHTRSNLNCDLSFKSGLSTMNSILVKTYLELDERIKFVVCAVKLWMKLNDLADRNLFTTYAQIWMVLFFLMQADIAVIPTVIKLKNMLPADQQILTVEGWNCSFPNVRNIVWRSSCTLTAEELVQRFFVFYSDTSLINYVLCTLTGLKLEKKHFLKFYDSLPEPFGAFKVRIMEEPTLFRKVVNDFESFCIQDPFDHCHNLTKTINIRKFAAFVKLCKKTTELLN